MHMVHLIVDFKVRTIYHFIHILIRVHTSAYINTSIKKKLFRSTMVDCILTGVKGNTIRVAWGFGVARRLITRQIMGGCIKSEHESMAKNIHILPTE